MTAGMFLINTKKSIKQRNDDQRSRYGFILKISFNSQLTTIMSDSTKLHVCIWLRQWWQHPLKQNFKNAFETIPSVNWFLTVKLTNKPTVNVEKPRFKKNSFWLYQLNFEWKFNFFPYFAWVFFLFFNFRLAEELFFQSIKDTQVKITFI